MSKVSNMSNKLSSTDLNFKANKNFHIGKIVLSICFAIISVLWVFPVIVVILNSFKVNTFVKTNTFSIPSGEMFAGFKNFITGMTLGTNVPFYLSALYSFIITILSTEMASFILVFLLGIISKPSLLLYS